MKLIIRSIAVSLSMLFFVHLGHTRCNITASEISNIELVYFDYRDNEDITYAIESDALVRVLLRANDRTHQAHATGLIKGEDQHGNPTEVSFQFLEDEIIVLPGFGFVVETMFTATYRRLGSSDPIETSVSASGDFYVNNANNSLVINGLYFQLGDQYLSLHLQLAGVICDVDPINPLEPDTRGRKKRKVRLPVQ